MIEKSTLNFLKLIKKNNNRIWFQAHKDLYEDARRNIEDITMMLLGKVSQFDDSVMGIEPKQCIFRFYRDTRFSSDKSPYKTNFGILLNNRKSIQDIAVYYLHIEPESSAVYCGAHLPNSRFLYRMRKNIEKRFDEFMKIINDKEFKKYFKEIDSDKLKNVPRGFEKESRAAEFLKYKEYIVGSGYSDSEVTSSDFLDSVAKKFKAAKKFNEFLVG